MITGPLRAGYLQINALFEKHPHKRNRKYIPFKKTGC
jgi:hypothetical protein